MSIRQKLGDSFLHYIRMGLFDKSCDYQDKFEGKTLSKTKHARVDKKIGNKATLGMGMDCWRIDVVADYYAEAEAEKRDKPEMKYWYYTLHFIYNMLTYRTRRWLNKPFFLLAIFS